MESLWNEWRMEDVGEPLDSPSVRKPSGLRYVWPMPVGVGLWLVSVSVAKFMGYDFFLLIHVPFEIGIMVAIVASFIYCFRLLRAGVALAPRWVLMLNLMFGPLIVVVVLVCAVIGRV